MARKSVIVQAPAALAVASVHPDYLDTCIKECCTALKFIPSLLPGTVTLLRRTAAGGGKKYGVVGVWWYTGNYSVIRPGDKQWSRRWTYLAHFKPLVLQFEDPFCEMFTEPVSEFNPQLKGSAKVRNLVYTSLQGSLVQIKDKDIGARYISALLKEKGADLKREAEYLEQRVDVERLLVSIATELSDGS